MFRLPRVQGASVLVDPELFRDRPFRKPVGAFRDHAPAHRQLHRSRATGITFQSSGWMWISQPSWSTNQTETGLVELSIQDSRSMAKGSGSV